MTTRMRFTTPIESIKEVDYAKLLRAGQRTQAISRKAEYRAMRGEPMEAEL